MPYGSLMPAAGYSPPTYTRRAERHPSSPVPRRTERDDYLRPSNPNIKDQASAEAYASRVEGVIVRDGDRRLREWTVCIPEEPEPLGITAYTDAHGDLVVWQVQADSTVATFNQLNPGVALLPGDRILQVNGFTEDHEMNRELRQLNLGNVEAAITVARATDEQRVAAAGRAVLHMSLGV